MLIIQVIVVSVMCVLSVLQVSVVNALGPELADAKGRRDLLPKGNLRGDMASARTGVGAGAETGAETGAGIHRVLMPLPAAAVSPPSPPSPPSDSEHVAPRDLQAIGDSHASSAAAALAGSLSLDALPVWDDMDSVELYHLVTFRKQLIQTASGATFALQTSGLALRSTTTGQVVVLEYRPVSYDASYLPRLRPKSETSAAERTGSGSGSGSGHAESGSSVGAGAGAGAEAIKSSGGRSAAESPLIWDERAFIKYNDHLDVTHWQHSTYLGLMNGIVFNKYTTWVTQYSPYLSPMAHATTNSTAAAAAMSSAGGKSGVRIGGRGAAAAVEAKEAKEATEEEDTGILLEDDFISSQFSETTQVSPAQAPVDRVKPFEPQSICSSGGGTAGGIEEACFTSAHTWESFIADTLDQLAGWSVALHAMLPPRAMELQILTNVQPTVVRADPRSTQHARHRGRGLQQQQQQQQGGGESEDDRKREVLSYARIAVTATPIAEADIYYYFSQLIICMDNYSNEDYVSALASCLPGAVAFVHVPNSADLYLRLEPRSPFAVHTEYLQVIPPARYPISQGILTADWLLGVALLLVVAAGGLRAAFQLKLHKAGCWCCARSKSDSSPLSFNSGSRHSLLGKHASGVDSSSSNINGSGTSSRSGASRSGGILDGVSLLINIAGQTPPASLRGRVWGSPGTSAAGSRGVLSAPHARTDEQRSVHRRKLTRGSVFFGTNARTFGGNTYSRTSTDADVDEADDDGDDREADMHELHVHASLGGGGIHAQTDEDEKNVEMVTRHMPARAGRGNSNDASDATSSRGRGGEVGGGRIIPITARTPTVLNLPHSSTSTNTGTCESTDSGSGSGNGSGSAHKRARSPKTSPPPPTTATASGRSGASSADASASAIPAVEGKEDDNDL